MQPAEILLIVVAVLVGFFLKGVTGIGAPLLIVPVLAGVTGLEFAVTVIAIPTLIANTLLLWETRGRVREVTWFMWPLLVAGAAGTVIGAWVLLNIDSRVMTITLALIILGYIAWSIANRDFALSERWARGLSAPVGLVGGILQGGTGASGPVIATYVHALHLDRAAFVLAVTVPFQILGVVQVISLALFGGYNRERLVAGFIATIPALIAMRPAMSLGRRLSQRTFQSVVLVILTLAAIRLIWSVL